MAAARARRTCPDCDGQLAAIRLIDRGENYQHWELGYAAGSSKRSMWGLGGYPIEGTVKGFLCGSCGRVLLYAAPTKRK
jgi:hypothetical protein